ncbi:hypothetical protein ncot_18785 [Nocardioides sp. JQ2195]|uniref:hypothetical protein n=1 Tax=Nocardioides sp. JQ2195 TaxID=2592334 RepID=UPI00143ED752|nr:hypothetical protein [Nocardioides sp. JQ2195]QIX28410.1 hypothetical protein ncot_18785 [Nocardioides sp. JQ2195]
MSACGCNSCGDPGTDPAGQALGDRLADWLSDLQLGEHLAEAGLPTYVRDAEGHARWTDPATGKAMTTAQLEGLDRQLHSDGSDPEHAVPVALLQLRRRAQVRAELVASEWFTYEGLAEVRGATVNATRFAVHRANADHTLLIVANDERTLVPAFQLTSEGEVRPEVVPLLRPLLAAGMDAWNAWAWLTQPAALLGGLVPERAAADPEEAELAAHAAVRLAERVAADT